MIDRIRCALQVKGADYLKVRVKETRSTCVVYAGKELERIGETTGRGGCVRALVRGGWGFAGFNDLALIPTMAQRAIEMATSIGGNGLDLSPIPPIQRQIRQFRGIDPRSIDLEQKHHLAAHYNQLLLSHTAIQSRNVHYEDRFKLKYLLTSCGTELMHEEIFCGFRSPHWRAMARTCKVILKVSEILTDLKKPAAMKRKRNGSLKTWWMQLMPNEPLQGAIPFSWTPSSAD